MSETHNLNGASGFRDRLLFGWLRWQALQGRQALQEELAEAVGKALDRRPPTSSTVSRWFTEAVPDLQTIEAIARVLGVPAGWLAFGEGEPPDDPATATFMPPRKPGPRG